jgi:hypothetical protein
MKTGNQKAMKTLILIIGIITGIVSLAFAQDTTNEIPKNERMQTLFGYDSKITGYGEFETKITGINGQEAVIIGGNGGVIFDGFFYFGIGAYGLVTSNVIQGVTPESSLDMSMGYTGLMMAFNIMPTKVVHLSVPLFTGVGNIELEHNNIFVENSAFLIFEPGLQVEINVTQFMKIGLGGGYRLVHGTNFRNPITDENLSNWTGNLTLVFGKFK